MPCESGDSDRGGGRRGRRCARLAERAALSSRVIPARQPVRERGMGRRPRRRELPWDRGPRGCRQGSRAPGYLWEGLPGCPAIVICLSQRLSHACLSIRGHLFPRNCEWLNKSVIVYLMVPNYSDNRSNSRANTCKMSRPHGRDAFIRAKANAGLARSIW
ncbi:hypothetical protein CLOP_g12900 [Closterium sp. NIES-67]|nr:hypothetical protein CLOP_g12900 [Closterium sp. NIES-67]